MGVLSWLREWRSASIDDHSTCGRVNPATGLPMTGALDVAGNPFGVDLHRSDAHHDSLSASASASHHDPFGDAHRIGHDPHHDSCSSASSSFDSGASWSSYDPTREW